MHSHIRQQPTTYAGAHGQHVATVAEGGVARLYALLDAVGIVAVVHPAGKFSAEAQDRHLEGDLHLLEAISLRV